MAKNVQVVKREKENNVSLLRRFTRRVQSSGVVINVKGRRYSEREESSYKKKKRALTTMKRREEYRRLYKLGRVGMTN